MDSKKRNTIYACSAILLCSFHSIQSASTGSFLRRNIDKVRHSYNATSLLAKVSVGTGVAVSFVYGLIRYFDAVKEQACREVREQIHEEYRVKAQAEMVKGLENMVAEGKERNAEREESAPIVDAILKYCVDSGEQVNQKLKHIDTYLKTHTPIK